MTDRIKELEAEIAMLKTEEVFAQAKKDYEAGSMTYEQYRRVKLAIREKRQTHRELREGRAPEAGEVRPGATVRKLAAKKATTKAAKK